MPTRQSALIGAWLLASCLAGATAFGQEVNNTFTFSLGGPCGEIVRGEPGSVYDDGTGGQGHFESGREGHTWEVLLSRETGPNVTESVAPIFWNWSLGVEGPVEITDVAIADPFPQVSVGEPVKFVELTGLPFGVGPQTEENHGARSCVFLGPQEPGMDRDGRFVLARIRVRGRFPEVAGDSVTARVYFMPREGTAISCSSLQELDAAVQGHMPVTRTEGNPPLVVEDCEFTLLAEAASDLVRCDANADGHVQVSDAIWMLTELFVGGATTRCRAAADCDGEGERNISDAIYALSYLFLGGPSPPAPFPDCGRIDIPVEECPPESTACS